MYDLLSAKSYVQIQNTPTYLLVHSGYYDSQVDDHYEIQYEIQKTKETYIMNKDIFEGNWKQLKGKVQEQWGKLTNDDLDVIEGKREQVVGKIQERYGITKDEAEKQINTWENDHRE